MVVEEMNILTTVFLRFDNQKVLYPDSRLWTKSIGNYYRSPDMGDGIEFSIHITTPAEKIILMKQRITKYIVHISQALYMDIYILMTCILCDSYIEGKKNHWYPAPMIVFKDMESLNSASRAINWSGRPWTCLVQTYMGGLWSCPNGTWFSWTKNQISHGHIGLRPNGHWASPIYLISRVFNLGEKLELGKFLRS